MDRFFERYWVGWSLAAALGLLFASTFAAGQTAALPLNNEVRVGPQELQRENLGSIFPGPVLEPGPHMVWVAVKPNATALPYSMWRSQGPYDVVAGRKYLVIVSGVETPVVTWKEWLERPGASSDPSAPASVSYLNQAEGDSIFGIAVVPATGPVPSVVITGALTSADAREPRHQCPHQAYPVTLEREKTYVVEMRGLDFDTYLMIEDADGNLLAQNDDDRIAFTNDALNSRVTFRPPATGTYRLIASAFSPSGEGNYTIIVREIPVIMRLDDYLTPCDEANEDCRYKTYDVALTAGRRYDVALESSEFPTGLKLLDPEGMIVAFDEGGGPDTNTRLTLIAPATGTYRLVATSFSPQAVGVFNLTVREDQ